MMTPGLNRRNLLKWTGVGATVMVAGAMLPNFGISAALAADLGAGDIGVLNYAYALEQLEAAFYIQVAKTPYEGITKAELSNLKAIRDHEIAHREFLRKALGRTAPGNSSRTSTTWQRPVRSCRSRPAMPPPSRRSGRALAETRPAARTSTRRASMQPCCPRRCCRRPRRSSSPPSPQTP